MKKSGLNSTKVFIDSFSGKVAELKRGNRSNHNVLAVLEKHPMVSTWDMGELPWLRNTISKLTNLGYILSLEEPYPWHRYRLTALGLAFLASAVT